MDSFVKNQLFELITRKVFPKLGRSEKAHRQFVFDCMDSHGLIKHQTRKESSHSSVKSKGSGQASNESEFTESYQSRSQSSVNVHGFNRTFLDPSQPSNLHELQKRGIEAEEVEFNEIKGILLDNLQNIVHHKPDINVQKILDTALTMYLNIMDYYKTNVLGLKQKKGSLKKGYISLCLYYGLIYNGVRLKKDELVKYTSAKAYDLPNADKAIKLIFENAPGYDFIFTKTKGTFIQLENSIQNNVNKVLSHIHGETVPSQVDMAAALYYICSIPISKGGVFDRIKVNGKSVTFEFLHEHTNLAKETISKRVKIIQEFYEKNKELKNSFL